MIDCLVCSQPQRQEIEATIEVVTAAPVHVRDKSRPCGGRRYSHSIGVEEGAVSVLALLAFRLRLRLLQNARARRQNSGLGLWGATDPAGAWQPRD
ncbi:hypothetical protein U9M48_018442 [Paspalum notatum var. saurae]|uniref:Uncharacterized protein n=1 Tax=Paspalum notatum var. saurae TaxID=547442 RepID=A0AAQ3TBS6_PASNO